MKRLERLTLVQLRKKANRIRNSIINVAVENEAGHIAPSLSCVDILTALYYRVMNLSRNPNWNGRDRLVFSKGHGCYGLYAILSDIGKSPFLYPYFWAGLCRWIGIG